jgi:hypothetical protein
MKTGKFPPCSRRHATAKNKKQQHTIHFPHANCPPEQCGTPGRMNHETGCCVVAEMCGAAKRRNKKMKTVDAD